MSQNASCVQLTNLLNQCPHFGENNFCENDDIWISKLIYCRLRFTKLINFDIYFHKKVKFIENLNLKKVRV